MNTVARTGSMLCGMVIGPGESDFIVFSFLIPGQCATRLILDHAGFEKIALFL